MKASNEDIFSRLRSGETISPDDPQGGRLREASYATMVMVQRMNNSSNQEEIRSILGQITESEIDA